MDFPWESFSSIPGEKGGGCNDPPSKRFRTRVEKYSTTFFFFFSSFENLKNLKKTLCAGKWSFFVRGINKM